MSKLFLWDAIFLCFNNPCLPVPVLASWKVFTWDLAVVFTCLHYEAWVAVTSVRARSVDAQLTAHTWARTFTLVNISTGKPVLSEPESCFTVTTLHSRNKVLKDNNSNLFIQKVCSSSMALKNLQYTATVSSDSTAFLSGWTVCVLDVNQLGQSWR